MPYCAECEVNSSSVCKKCNLNFNWDGNNCVCNISQCTKCNDSTLEVCDIFNTNYIYSSEEKKCKCKDANCLTCDSANGSICISCNSGFIVDSSTKDCIA